MASRYFSGIVRSSQKVIGLTGSDNVGAGSFFSRRQRLMLALARRARQVVAEVLRHGVEVAHPRVGLARRIGCAGSVASE